MAYKDRARLAAFELLMNVETKDAYANLEMPQILKKYQLEGRDAAFATELGYGTLRMRSLYDSYIAKVSDRPISKIDLKVLNVLRLALHQIVTLKTPSHAATSESVELARYVAGKSTTGFVNAILRKSLEIERQIEWGDSISEIATQFSHPEWIVQSYLDVLQDKDEVVELLKANNSPVKPDFIAWPGKSDRELESGEIIPHTQFGFTSSIAPVNLPGIVAKRVGVQDRGSQIVTEIFLATSKSSSKEEPKLAWLDMCAGPGGKAAYIFNYLATFRPQDTFIANEISPHRAELVARVVPKEIVTVNPGQQLSGTFDRILIDAPCTGLGALRRRPESRWRKNIGDLKALVGIQRELLDRASELLSDEGIMAYVTCSPHNAETRLQVAEFLHRHPNFSLLSVAPFVDENLKQYVSPNGVLQLWTHINNSDSMFIALFQKNSRAS